MVYKVVSRGSVFMKIQLAGISGREYEVKVNNVTKSNLSHNALITFTGLKPGVNYNVYLYLLPLLFGRIVIRNNSKRDALNFNEVQVTDHNDEMVSHIPSKVLSVVQTDTLHGGHASRALDGNLRSWVHTRAGGTKYWVLSFKAPTTIKQVRIYNRKDCCQTRLKGCLLKLDNPSKKTVFSRTLNGSMDQAYTFDI